MCGSSRVIPSKLKKPYVSVLKQMYIHTYTSPCVKHIHTYQHNIENRAGSPLHAMRSTVELSSVSTDDKLLRGSAYGDVCATWKTKGPCFCQSSEPTLL